MFCHDSGGFGDFFEDDGVYSDQVVDGAGILAGDLDAEGVVALFESNSPQGDRSGGDDFRIVQVDLVTDGGIALEKLDFGVVSGSGEIDGHLIHAVGGGGK